jgi:hypothetical protein
MTLIVVFAATGPLSAGIASGCDVRNSHTNGKRYELWASRMALRLRGRALADGDDLGLGGEIVLDGERE